MFDATTLLFCGTLVLVVSAGLGAIFSFGPKCSRTRRKDTRRAASSPEEELSDEVDLIRETYLGLQDDEKETDHRAGIFREQYASLARMAPRAAVVKVWREVEILVVRAAADELRKPPMKDCTNIRDAWALLDYCEVIDADRVALFEALEQLRNRIGAMAPGAVDSRSAEVFIEVSAFLLAEIDGLRSIGPAAVSQFARRAERGVAMQAFSVMPLTKNQRIVHSEKEGQIINTPEVLKLPRHLRSA